MDDLFTVPQAVEPLTAWGYVGYGLLAVVALAILVGAAVAHTELPPAGLALTAVGGGALFPAAFRFLRAVPFGWNLPNLLVCGGLLVAGVVATIIARRLIEARHYGYDTESSFLPLGGVVIAAIAAGVLDWLNERLAAIPMSWGMIGVLIVLALLFVLSQAGDRR